MSKKDYRTTGGRVNSEAIKKLKESSVYTKPPTEPFKPVFTENPWTPEEDKFIKEPNDINDFTTKMLVKISPEFDAMLKKMSEIDDWKIPTSYVVFETYPILQLSAVKQICEIVFEDKPIVFIEEFEKMQQDKIEFKTLFAPYVTTKSFWMRGKEYPRNKLLTHEQLKHMFEILKLGKFNPWSHIKPLEVNNDKKK